MADLGMFNLEAILAGAGGSTFAAGFAGYKYGRQQAKEDLVDRLEERRVAELALMEKHHQEQMDVLRTSHAQQIDEIRRVHAIQVKLLQDRISEMAKAHEEERRADKRAMQDLQDEMDKLKREGK